MLVWTVSVFFVGAGGGCLEIACSLEQLGARASWWRIRRAGGPFRLLIRSPTTAIESRSGEKKEKRMK